MRIWKEEFDKGQHRDFMSTDNLGGSQICDSRHIEFVYFVKVVGETFQFVSLDQVIEMREYLS